MTPSTTAASVQRPSTPPTASAAPASTPGYTCPHCPNPKLFTRPSTLQEHIRAQHTTDRLYCNQCNKPFRRANDLRRHEKLHEGVKPFECRVVMASKDGEMMRVGCGKGFARLHSLREHQRRKVGSSCWDAFVAAQGQSSVTASASNGAEEMEWKYDNMSQTTAPSVSAITTTAPEQCLPPRARNKSVYIDPLSPSPIPEESDSIYPTIEAAAPTATSYQPVDWRNWSMDSSRRPVQPAALAQLSQIPPVSQLPQQTQTASVSESSRQTQQQTQPQISASDISWHSVLESRLRHDVDELLANSRNSSISSNGSRNSTFSVASGRSSISAMSIPGIGGHKGSMSLG
jgi:hypothetical protein